MPYLYGKKKQVEFMLEQMSGLVNTYQNYFSSMYQHTETARKNTKKEKHYPFIPSGSSLNIARSFLELKEYFMKEHPYIKGASDDRRYYFQTKPPRYVPRFIDCGCGIGNISMIAKFMGFRSCGIEYNTELVRVARKLLVGWDINITEGDIRTYKHYSEFDLIYFYIPMCDYEGMKQFIEKIMKEAKVGAVILSFAGYTCGGILSSEDRRFKKLKLKNLIGHTLVKVKN